MFGSIWPTQTSVPTFQQRALLLLGGSRFQLLQLGHSRVGNVAAPLAPLSRYSSSCCLTSSCDRECAAVSGTPLPVRWNWSEPDDLTDGRKADRSWGPAAVAAPVVAVLYHAPPSGCHSKSFPLQLLRVHLSCHFVVVVSLVTQKTAPAVEVLGCVCSGRCLVKGPWQRQNSTNTPSWPIAALRLVPSR